MSKLLPPRKLTRRDFLRMGGAGALAVAAGSVLSTSAGHIIRARAAPSSAPPSMPLAVPPAVFMRLAATDGFILLPGRDPLYVFGFVTANLGDTITQVTNTHKGLVQNPAPIIGVEQDAELYLTLTNIGLVVRPDLDDAHTVHWHGFRNPIALFDGVPEASISVPPGRDFPYFYRPNDPGTYMYHCHFEDVEHVQMGMDGVIIVRPAQNFTGAGGGPVARLGGNAGSPVLGYVYNDGVAPASPVSTAYDREFALLLNEIDPHPHDGLAAVQEFIWSNYKPSYWVINGRAYPDTVRLSNDPALEIDGTIRQPISSLIQVNSGDRALLRFVNLGYEQHVMQLAGITMRVAGEDATFLRGPGGVGGADLSYRTNTIYIGPGESRDALFTAPVFSGPGEIDPTIQPLNPFNRYLLKNRSPHKQTNGGLPGLGGMVTEVRVYQNPLPAQTAPNVTYP